MVPNNCEDGAARVYHPIFHGLKDDNTLAPWVPFTNDKMFVPLITPSNLSPRDRPSIPLEIIRVPATWKRCNVKSPFICMFYNYHASVSVR